MGFQAQRSSLRNAIKASVSQRPDYNSTDSMQTQAIDAGNFLANAAKGRKRTSANGQPPAKKQRIARPSRAKTPAPEVSTAADVAEQPSLDHERVVPEKPEAVAGGTGGHGPVDIQMSPHDSIASSRTLVADKLAPEAKDDDGAAMDGSEPSSELDEDELLDAELASEADQQQASRLTSAAEPKRSEQTTSNESNATGADQAADDTAIGIPQDEEHLFKDVQSQQASDAAEESKPERLCPAANLQESKQVSLDEHVASIANGAVGDTVPTVPQDGEGSTESQAQTAELSPVAAAYPSPPGTQDSDNGSSVVTDMNPELLKLSRALTYRKPLAEKDAPQGQPRVWADSRQALCETVPYFKKPQGGCHSKDGHAYAFLFDGVGHCREYMDSDVIIARAGGGMESDSSIGSMLQVKDQKLDESQVLAVINDIVLQNPLIVICGNKNTGALSKMPHKYCVLGWFKPVAVWAEKTAGKGKKNWTTIKYRFERLGSDEVPAWHAPKSIDMPNTAGLEALFEKTCTACDQRHPQVYLESWMCLNPTCHHFWQLDDGKEAPCGKLEYNPAYLLTRTRWDVEIEPFDVRPRLPTIGKTVGDNLTYINTRGVCCPECGRCNQRYKFTGWQCENPDCNWALHVQHQPVMPANLHNPWESLGDGPALGCNKHKAGVNVQIRYTHHYKVYRYTFTGVEGCFVHAVANKIINQEQPDGPDAMLAEIQIVDMGLERRRFVGGKVSGSMEGEVTRASQRKGTGKVKLLTPPAEQMSTLNNGDVEEVDQATGKKLEVEDGDFMTAFSMNYGMPYKFVASGASKSFEDAPLAVRACRSRLNWAAKEFLADQSTETDFNEELVFAYMEGQKIEYHDDGEEGLGPRIATLSLGGKAKMHMRMKKKHFVGCSKTGVLTADEPLLGSMEYEKRHRAWTELQPLKESDRAAYRRRQKEIPKEIGIYDKRNKNPDDLVTVTLGHGDIVLMDGYDIQKYLEHKVVPEGYLRFALTCRTVLEHHLKEHERPRYEVKPDDYGYDGSKLL
ncbi:Uu.00g021840.m01.CDS01 [Anthostomella pinea]|uniref:Uu.00g021840.m01.CDS01 n=1 Tax=Anthostomella pinea TaxID=933095 RepID=A0AAI8W098_9PEZI|nr:Uu.00g021840.m01.CDS01 [Anthostomella pinea]